MQTAVIRSLKTAVCIQTAVGRPARRVAVTLSNSTNRARRHAGRALRPRRHHRHRLLPGSGPAVISILVVEDHPRVRRGIVGFLSSQLDLAVVAEAGEGES